MKKPEKMTYRAMEQEVIENRIKIRTASPDQKRSLILRNHSLMVEMDRRWQVAEEKRKQQLHDLLK